MRDNVQNWTERKRKIDEKLEEFLTLNEDQRPELSEKMAKQDTQCSDEFDKGFAKMKRTDDEEKLSLTELLLKTDDNKEDADTSNNYRGQPSTRGRRRHLRR